MSGTDFVLEFPYVTSLEDKLVNKAELELPIILLPDDDPVNGPLEQIIAYEIFEDGTFRQVDDVDFAINRAGPESFSDIFGGTVEPDDVYRLNISVHFQNMIRGAVTNKMLIRTTPKKGQAARVVLGGPQNGFSAAKLNLTFTNL